MLLLHHRHPLGHIEGRIALATAVGVGSQRLLELVGQAEIIHDESTGLVLEHAVHPCDGLHESVVPHRLVHVHGVQAGGVEAGEPHVPHQDKFQRVGWVFKPHRQLFASLLVAHMLLPLKRIGGAAGHDDLDLPFRIIVVVPLWAQPRDRRIQLDADAEAHAHDHRFAVHRIEAVLEVLDKILRDQGHALIGTDEGFERGPLGLELLLALDLLTLGCFLELFIQMWPVRRGRDRSWRAWIRSRSARLRHPPRRVECRRR